MFFQTFSDWKMTKLFFHTSYESVATLRIKFEGLVETIFF